MIRTLVAIVFALCAIASVMLPVRANTCTVPNSLVNGQVVDANGLNTNFVALQSCGNNIDSTNIGPAGILASQIISNSAAAGTFGGTATYAFPHGIIANASPNTIAFGTGAFSGTFPNIQNSTDNGINLQTLASSTLGYRFFKYDGTTLTQLAQLDNSGNLTAIGSGTFAGPLASGVAAVGMFAGDISAARSASTGALFLGSNGSQNLNFNITTPGAFTFSGGAVQAPSGISGSNVSAGLLAAGVSPGDLSASRTATSGAIFLGSNGAQNLNYNITNAGAYTFNGGAVQAASGFASGSSTYGAAGATVAGPITGTNVSSGTLAAGVSAGDLSTSRTANTGALFFGSNGSQNINFGISNPGLTYTINGGGLVISPSNTAAAELSINTAFSGVYPTLGASGEGGYNSSIAASSTLGYRFFKYDGTTLTQLAQLLPSGGLTATSVAAGAIATGSSNGDLSAARNASTGALFLGANGVADIDFNISNANKFSLIGGGLYVPAGAVQVGLAAPVVGSYISHGTSGTYPYDATVYSSTSHIERWTVTVTTAGVAHTFTVPYSSASSYQCSATPDAFFPTGVLATTSKSATSITVVVSSGTSGAVDVLCDGN